MIANSPASWSLQRAGRVFCFLALCSLLPSQGPRSNPIGVGGEYRVGPGDVLDIRVFEVEELSKPAVVSPRGTVSLPLIGEVSVEHMTTLEIEARLKQLYEINLLQDPQINVSVQEFRSQPVSVLGAVERPGVYQLQGRRRLVEVLAMAGGLTSEVGDVITISRSPLLERPDRAPDDGSRGAGPQCPPDALASEHDPASQSEHPLHRGEPLQGPAYTVSTQDSPARKDPCPQRPPRWAPALRSPGANPGRVRLPEFSPGAQQRFSREEIQVSVRDLLMLDGSHGSNPLILAHDVIRVAKAGVIYVLGAVEKPGGFRIKDQEIVTVLRAVSLAGGLGRHAAPRKSRIIRQSGGLNHEIPLSIRDILHDRAPDSPLEPNDILFIPDSRAKSALSRSAEAAIQMGTGIVIWRR